MAGEKKEVIFEIQADLVNMLDHLKDKYDLASKDKALRCILDYVATDGDWDEIFNVRRCIRCGSKTGWKV
ncbi:MAG: hypothetical protein CL772_02475 [Chloroflexi bacterium]|nr:hypothetical protein [Chloroflexota bacterium]MBK90027.1 hypothetical protein [Chloroflexota bacterium]|tara:strand:- start:678 stop:887 length:210 start_codon:yes stop_codon:yes gene_type:complete